MTLIYAEKRESLIYILGDTFWTRAGSQELPTWALDPLVKVIPVLPDVTVAYAGNANAAENAIREITKNGSGSVPAVLLKAHQESLAGEDEQSAVEFLMAERSPMKLTQMKRGKMEDVESCFLGSTANFSRFQEFRHRTEQNPQPDTSFNITQLPEDCSETDCARYSDALTAFQLTLRSPVESECGGFCVPYIISKDSSGFMMYLENYRGPISDQELGLSGSGTVPLNDQYSGGYQLIFNGSAASFSAHFVNGNFAFIHRGFDANGLETSKFTGQDPYDVAHEAETAGIPAAISSWTSTRNDAVKIRQLFSQGNFVRAEDLIRASSAALANRLSKQAEGKPLDFEQGIVEPLHSAGDLSVSIDDLNHIGFLLEARAVYFERSGKFSDATKAKKELKTWRDQIQSVRFKMSFTNISRT